MKRYCLISVLSLSFAVASPAATPPARIAILPGQIAAAISATGMRVSAEQVVLLTDVLSATPAPALEVESMQPWGDHRMRVRLACAVREQCLPFFVAVRLDPEPAQPSGAELDRTPGSASNSIADSKAIVLRAGSPATLLLDGPHVHIRIAVICLENGAPGQTIRVTSKDHRQTYVARVVDEAILRAGL